MEFRFGTENRHRLYGRSRRLGRGKAASPVLTLIIGVLLVVGAYFLAQNTKEFLKTALPANGQVTEIREEEKRERTSDGERLKLTYTTTIRFVPTGAAETVSFTTSGSHGRVGEQIEILYNPANPHDARLKSDAASNVVPLALGGFGLLALVIGIVGLFKKNAPPLTIESLQQRGGQEITASLMQVPEMMRGLMAMANHEAQPMGELIAQWDHPTTRKKYVFHFASPENLSFDPTAGGTVQVVIDPKNPKDYVVKTETLRPL